MSEPSITSEALIAVDQGMSEVIINRTHLLKSTLFKMSRFVVEQGSHPDDSAFALSLISRYYQALRLWPEDLSQKLFEQAQDLTPQDRVSLGQQLVNLLRPWLSHQLNEMKVADLYRSLCAVLSKCDGNLLELLALINDEILSPLKTRLNPRKLIEVEERMGGTLYQAILELNDEAPQNYLPQSVWPNLSEYRLLYSMEPWGGLFPFEAIRISDQSRCTIYISDEVIPLLPYIEEGEWPVHCVFPLETGRGELTFGSGSHSRATESFWISLPSAGSITLESLIPHNDIYTALYIGEQLLETLAALHQLGVCFGDLHPSRVVIDHRFQLRLLPYMEETALYRGWNGATGMRERHLRSVYCSPEQRSGQRGDLRSDLWAFGAIFYELITRRPLISIESLSDLSEISSTSGIVPLSDDFSNSLKLILKRCLHPNPDHRWSDAQRVLETYRPVSLDVRQTLKSRGRSAQWSKVIGDGHLRDFINRHIDAPPHPVNPSFFKFLESRSVTLSTAENPSSLLTTLFAQEEALNEDIDKWSLLLEEALHAQDALIHRIKDESPAVTYGALEELLDEKVLIQQALTQAESKIAFFERRRPKLFGLALERFVEDSELDLDLHQLLDLDWSMIDVVPEELQVDLPDLSTDLNGDKGLSELDRDLMEPLIEDEVRDREPLHFMDQEDQESDQPLLISFEDDLELEVGELEVGELEVGELEVGELEVGELVPDVLDELMVEALRVHSEAFNEPAKASSEPTEASSEPTEVSSEPAEASSEPTEVSSEPAEASSEPTDVSSEPAEASSEPTDVSSEPAEASSEPTEASSEPAETSSEPAEASSEPAEASSEPAEASSEPAEASSEPAEASSEPAEESSEPAEASSEPVEEIPSQERVTIEVREVSAVEVDREVVVGSSGAEVTRVPKPAMNSTPAEEQSIVMIDGIDDFADLSILERDQLPEDELTDHYEFNELTGIEDLPDSNQVDPLFGQLKEGDPLHKRESSSETAITEKPLNEVRDFLEVSLDSPSLVFDDSSDEVFTSAPAPKQYHDSLSLSLDSIPVNTVKSSTTEPEEARPVDAHPVDAHPVDALSQEISSVKSLQEEDEILYREDAQDQVSMEQEANRREGLVTPEVQEITAEPSQGDRPLNDESAPVSEALKNERALAEQSALMPDKEMISSLVQLMRLEAEGARKNVMMTPVPQVPTMTVEERRQIHDLFDRYLTLKTVYGEPTEEITFEDFQLEIDQAREIAMTVHGWDIVRFTVKVREGKVVLKARKV